MTSKGWKFPAHAGMWVFQLSQMEPVSMAATLNHCSRVWGDRILSWEYFRYLSNKQEPAQERTVKKNP